MPRTNPRVLDWEHRKTKTSETRAKHAAAQDRMRELEDTLKQELDGLADELHMGRDIVQAAFRAQRFQKTMEGVSATNAARHVVARDYREAGRKFDLTSSSCHEDVLAKQEELEAQPAALEDVRHEILAAREQKRVQVRRPGKSKQVDTLHVQDDFQREAANFNIRTGGHACGFVLRGSVKDLARPQWFGDEACRAFFEDVLKIPIEELVLALEAWVLSGGAHGTAERVHARVNQHKSAIRAMLDKGLQAVTKDAAARMAYSRFGLDIEDRYGVTLQGWPLAGSITNPSNISGLMSLVTLRKALASGTCHFRPMTALDRDRRDAERKSALSARSNELATLDAQAAGRLEAKARRRKRPAPSSMDSRVPVRVPEEQEAAPSPAKRACLTQSSMASQPRSADTQVVIEDTFSPRTQDSSMHQAASALAHGSLPQALANAQLGSRGFGTSQVGSWPYPPPAGSSHFMPPMPSMVPLSQPAGPHWWAAPPQGAGVTMNHTYIVMDTQMRGAS
ncbi:hypothetical protein CALCODRAFT_512757 [Calocera cornea HHB12733]|uniref:Uncharacterized protein n=1 Tax=Calocera cornea HHB12733 TaxID=1353952 RepID=A0A165CSV2_9BASI|nr:hypothetical protein CALCODRAFT_512757 [Calocera cornea HHB12733]